MLIVRGVNIFPTQIEELLLARAWCGGHFQIVLSRDGRMDQMAVHVEARPEHWDGEGLLDEARLVMGVIKNTIGVTTRVVVEPPGTLARSLGKVKRVIDSRTRV
jgi:phenylacetate-CoA ligase